MIGVYGSIQKELLVQVKADWIQSRVCFALKQRLLGVVPDFTYTLFKIIYEPFHHHLTPLKMTSERPIDEIPLYQNVVFTSQKQCFYLLKTMFLPPKNYVFGT